MEHKKQHFVPTCYLKAWCDPRCPPGHKPYVWIHAKDCAEGARKAPENILYEPDYYTFYNSDGSRELFLEKYISQIETIFPSIRDKIHSSRSMPTGDDMSFLCLFAALMLNRTKRRKETMLDFFHKLHSTAVQAEKAYGTSSSLSSQLSGFMKYGHHHMMVHSLTTILEFLDKMSKAILFNDNGSFITSDTPSDLYNPNAYKLPPIYRNPGLAVKDVEFMFPISQFAMFVATWSNLKGAKVISETEPTHLNRLYRFNCHEYYITRDGITDPAWFDPGQEPDDSWEKLNHRK